MTPRASVVPYQGEQHLPAIMRMMEESLSEPYSIFTYRYFLASWPQFCFVVEGPDSRCLGAIICRLAPAKSTGASRGYIAMLATLPELRRQGFGQLLVKSAVGALQDAGAEEVVLETEVTNVAAVGLYERLGFLKEKRLHCYYLNGSDAFRLKLLMPDPQPAS